MTEFSLCALSYAAWGRWLPEGEQFTGLGTVYEVTPIGALEAVSEGRMQPGFGLMAPEAEVLGSVAFSSRERQALIRVAAAFGLRDEQLADQVKTEWRALRRDLRDELIRIVNVCDADKANAFEHLWEIAKDLAAVEDIHLSKRIQVEDDLL